MSLAAKAKAREIAGKITEALGGRGIFGVELFIKGDDVIFSEVSPRPHDTGMVTMITQDLSQFALHARAVLGLPIPNIVFHGAGASRAVVVEGDSDRLSLGNLDKVLEQPDTQMRFFGNRKFMDIAVWRLAGSWFGCDGGKGEDRSDDGAVKC